MKNMNKNIKGVKIMVEEMNKRDTLNMIRRILQM